MIGTVLSLFQAGMTIYESVSGKVSEASNEQELKDEIKQLPPEQQAEVLRQIGIEKQKLDTQRFLSMNEGGADKIKASARPEIALRAMAVIETFSKVFLWLIIFTMVEYVLRFGFALNDKWDYPDVSIWGMVAEAQPVTEMIWGPLIASFGVCMQVILKYMGCRERDKARRDEMIAGRPLESAAASVEAAGGAISSIIKAVRRK